MLEKMINDERFKITANVKKLIANSYEKITSIKQKKLKFVIEGDPVSSKRPRYSGRHFYVPDAAKNKTIIGNIIKEQLPKDFELIKTGIKLNINAYRSSKSFSTTEQVLCEYGYIRPTKKPDSDNVCKAYMDVMNKLVYDDDAQIFNLNYNAYFSNNPRVEIEVIYDTDFRSNKLKK